MKELIEALRCSASPYSKNVDCKSCRYRLLEPVNDKIPVQCDVVIIDEVKYWESCDVDRIALDAADALENQTEYQKRIKGLVNTIEDICKKSRDRHVDDEHCGLCEYDGAYVGESGEWVNECPGFDTDDCFVLSKEFRNKCIDWSEEE